MSRLPHDTPQHILDQRQRKLIMDALAGLATGDEGVLGRDLNSYFSEFFDALPGGFDGPPGTEGYRCNTAMSPSEDAELALMRLLVVEACETTLHLRTATELVASGWPSRLQHAARHAFGLFATRGPFYPPIEGEGPQATGPDLMPHRQYARGYQGRREHRSEGGPGKR